MMLCDESMTTTQFGASTTTGKISLHKSHEEALSSPKKKTHSVKNPARAKSVETSRGCKNCANARFLRIGRADFIEANVPMGGHDVHRWGFGHVREANDAMEALEDKQRAI